MAKRICLIGPIDPYTGGIAHFNNCLVNELRRLPFFKVYSWKKRYPNFLFPGKDQIDPERIMEVTNDDKFCLNFFNPLTWINLSLEIRRYKADLLILNWVTPFLSPVLLILLLLRRKSTKALLICHNVLPHERRFVDKFLAKIVFSRVDRFVVHAASEVEQLKGIKSNASYILLDHPPYGFFKEKMSISSPDVLLNLPRRGYKLLYFGMVREYKGLDVLLRAIPLFSETEDFHLVVAGEFWENINVYHKIILDLGIADKVTIIDSYIPDSSVGHYFAWCDCVVLPYKRATQSGIAQIARSFNKPVVTTNVGGLKDFASKHKDVYLCKPNDEEDLMDAIRGCLHKTETNVQKQSSWSWADYSEAVINLY